MKKTNIKISQCPVCGQGVLTTSNGRFRKHLTGRKGTRLCNFSGKLIGVSYEA